MEPHPPSPSSGPSSPPPVAATVWNWRTGPAATGGGADPARPSLGFFALQVLIPASVAAWLYLARGHRVFPAILATIALLALVGRLAIPPLYRALCRGGEALAHVIVRGLTWALLTPIFYLIFVPARLGLLLRRRDPMTRACPSPEPTYWHPRPPVRHIRQYEKQH